MVGVARGNVGPLTLTFDVDLNVELDGDAQRRGEVEEVGGSENAAVLLFGAMRSCRCGLVSLDVAVNVNVKVNAHITMNDTAHSDHLTIRRAALADLPRVVRMLAADSLRAQPETLSTPLARVRRRLRCHRA